MSKYDNNGLKHWETPLLKRRQARLEKLLKAYPHIGRGIRTSWSSELAAVKRILEKRKGAQ